MVCSGCSTALKLVCAAVIISGLLIARQFRNDHDIISSGIRSRWALEIAAVLLAIALIPPTGSLLPWVPWVFPLTC